MKEFCLTKDDIDLMKEIECNRNEGYGDNINISKLTQNIIYDFSNKLGLDFEETAELLIHKGAKSISILKVKIGK